MIIAYTFFIRGFIILSKIFENDLLKIGSYLMIIAVAAIGILDVSTLWTSDTESLWIPYTAASVVIGALTLILE